MRRLSITPILFALACGGGGASVVAIAAAPTAAAALFYDFSTAGQINDFAPYAGSYAATFSIVNATLQASSTTGWSVAKIAPGSVPVISATGSIQSTVQCSNTSQLIGVFARDVVGDHSGAYLVMFLACNTGAIAIAEVKSNSSQLNQLGVYSIPGGITLGTNYIVQLIVHGDDTVDGWLKTPSDTSLVMRIPTVSLTSSWSQSTTGAWGVNLQPTVGGASTGTWDDITFLTAPSNQLKVNPNITFQTITGFGAQTLSTITLTDAQWDSFFDPNNGIGLSLAPLHYEGGTGNLDPASVASGNENNAVAKIKARPQLKTFGVMNTLPSVWVIPGGNGYGQLDPAHYQDYANAIVNFPATLLANGISISQIYGISMCNEPDDGGASFPFWTGAQIQTFLKNNLGPTLRGAYPTVKIISPEVISVGTLPSRLDPTLTDALTRPYLDVAATHGYTGSARETALYANATNNGKPLWQTEVNPGATATFDATMTSGLFWAQQIHNAMVDGYSAWLYFLLHGMNLGPGADFTGKDFGILGDNLATTKRYYTIGNFSKFVRPGYVRIAITGTSSFFASAYTGPGNALVIVAVNAGGSPVSATLDLTAASGGPKMITPYQTDASNGLTGQASITDPSGVIPVTVPASSVVTYVATVAASAASTAAGTAHLLGAHHVIR